MAFTERVRVKSRSKDWKTSVSSALLTVFVDLGFRGFRKPEERSRGLAYIDIF